MSKIFNKVVVHTVNDSTNHYWLSEIVIWLRYIFYYFIFIISFNALLSLFLTAYHYNLGVFFPAKDTKAGAIEGCLTWMSLTLSDTECMSSLDIYVSIKPQAIKILKLCVFFIIFFWGLLHLDFNRSCGMKKQSVQYTSRFSIHSMQATAICSRNGFSCLNCGISRVLESWPFRCALSMHFYMVAVWLFNKDEVCWHILLTSITYLPLQRRCMECSRFIIFP